MTDSLLRPRLRSLDLRWIDQNGQKLLTLKDRQDISDKIAVVRPLVAVILSLFDGDRDIPAICTGVELRTGLTVSHEQVEEVIHQLDEALLLDSPRFALARAEAIRSFRDEPYRSPTLAGLTYPAEASSCRESLSLHSRAGQNGRVRARPVRGVISPHIDYPRGGPVYGATWDLAANAARDAELIVILGTDHNGGFGRMTLTRQNYATPFGVLPTDTTVVERLAEALDPSFAFEEELNHKSEHSIELCAVWLHSLLPEQNTPPRIVPILCGSFQHFIEGIASPHDNGWLDNAVEVLQDVIGHRQTLVVAAADLAHVGPQFGDAFEFGPGERGALSSSDKTLLQTICSGDADAFLAAVARDRDRNRICGLPPIYWMLRALGKSDGDVVDYRQCPADDRMSSWVSIAGVLLH